MSWKPDGPYGRLQGATNLHRAHGVNRRSREERQGRNVLSDGIARPKENRTGKLESTLGVDRRNGMSMEGRSLENPMRGASSRTTTRQREVRRLGNEKSAEERPHGPEQSRQCMHGRDWVSEGDVKVKRARRRRRESGNGCGPARAGPASDEPRRCGREEPGRPAWQTL